MMKHKHSQRSVFKDNELERLVGRCENGKSFLAYRHIPTGAIAAQYGLSEFKGAKLPELHHRLLRELRDTVNALKSKRAKP